MTDNTLLQRCRTSLTRVRDKLPLPASGPARHAALAAPVLAALLLVVLLLTPRQAVPDFSQYAAGPERKQAFFDFLLPHVLERNLEILETRSELQRLQDKPADSLSGSERRRLAELAEEYNIETFEPDSDLHWDTLLRRIDIVPPSLALAQAANESAWGTSRFAQKGNNLYGQWCYEKGCGIVPNARPDGATYEVRSFRSVEDAVATYIRNLNRNAAYDDLRAIRHDLRNSGATISGMQLASGLTSYSERGEAYVAELREMISFNDLDSLDARL